MKPLSIEEIRKLLSLTPQTKLLALQRREKRAKLKASKEAIQGSLTLILGRNGSEWAEETVYFTRGKEGNQKERSEALREHGRVCKQRGFSVRYQIDETEPQLREE